MNLLPTCKNWEISFLFKFSLFLKNWKLEELEEKPATWQHRAGSREQLFTFRQAHALPGSAQWSPACFTHQITCRTPTGICISHPSFKELRQKSSLSELHYFSFSQKLILQRSFPTSEVLRKKSDNVFKSPRIRGSHL